MKTTLLCTIILLLVGCANGTTVSTKTDSTPVSPTTPSVSLPPSLFGMHLHNSDATAGYWPAAKFSSLRIWDTYTNWLNLEPQRGVYDWTNLDSWLADAEAHNVSVMYTFGGVPQWAASNPAATPCDYNTGSCSPPSLTDWNDWVTAVVTHAGTKIQYWEIWNEANRPAAWAGDMPTLVAMAQSACSIIHQINPNAVVITPSSTTKSQIGPFLQSYFAAGGGACEDAVSFHGYVTASADITTEVETVKNAALLAGYGSKPIYDTEGSWGLNSGLTDPQQQATFIQQWFTLQYQAGVQTAYWYAWDSPATSNSPGWGSLFVNGSITPAGQEYQTLAGQ